MRSHPRNPRKVEDNEDAKRIVQDKQRDEDKAISLHKDRDGSSEKDGD
tara:strand:- start:14324 stop:14467 length:144 start_codon:yes stop_codon:yes gene_type:complete